MVGRGNVFIRCIALYPMFEQLEPGVRRGKCIQGKVYLG